MTTETVICARCKQSFERELEEVHSVQMQTEETEPVCDDCEHEFLSWANCPPLC